MLARSAPRGRAGGPVPPARTGGSARYADRNLAAVDAATQMGVRLLRLAEREDGVDHRPDGRPDCRTELGDGANVDAPQIDRFHQDGARVHRPTEPGEHADQRYFTTWAYCLERLIERAWTADLDDMVDTFPARAGLGRAFQARGPAAADSQNSDD